MTAAEALEFVHAAGIVLQSARGPAPSLAEAVAGEQIRGSWWGHPKSHLIFRLLGAVGDSGNVVVCRLVDGKITFVHRRLWPALVRLAGRLPTDRLASVREIHTAAGKHVVEETPFPRWVPEEDLRAGKEMSEQEAVKAIGAPLLEHLTGAARTSPSRRAAKQRRRRRSPPS